MQGHPKRRSGHEFIPDKKCIAMQICYEIFFSFNQFSNLEMIVLREIFLRNEQHSGLIDYLKKYETHVRTYFI